VKRQIEGYAEVYYIFKSFLKSKIKLTAPRRAASLSSSLHTILVEMNEIYRKKM
jgi:hypothetical protein